MTPPDQTLAKFVNEQKARTGFTRLRYAAMYSWQGLRAGWTEPAFRLESVFAFVFVPLAFWVGRTWVEVALLAGSILLVMAIELLNTAVEAAIDRIGPERHDLSKRAKDMGSGAVLLAVVLAFGIWLAALYHFFAALQ
jgi:diacylglycerol kinase (ATP)